MITKIMSRNFKGLSFDQEIDQYNLIFGPNGSGKSARSHALQLAIMGYIPSDQVKQPSAILAIHGSGEEMTVGFEANGKRLTRRVTMVNGTGRMETSINGKKISEKEVSRALIDMGDPQIFDLRAFNELSPNKKIEFLLERFPPADGLFKMDDNIARLEEKEKSLRADIRAAKQAIDRLNTERSSLNLPAGTLAEIQAEIKAKEKELEVSQEELKAKEKEEAAKKAAEEARIKAEKAAAKKLENVRREGEDALAKAERSEKVLKEDLEKSKTNEARFEEAMKKAGDGLTLHILKEDYLKKLYQIRAAIPYKTKDKTCDLCPAVIILNQEITRLEK